MASWWQAQRERLNHDLPTIDQRAGFSAILFGSRRVTVRAMEQYVRGRVLEVGAGDSPYRPQLERLAKQYDTLDRETRGQPPTYLADAQDMKPVPSNTYDTVISLQVFEHLPEPARAMSEIFRVLKPGGHLILSVPHLSRLHEEPLDFFRYTEFGLRALITKAGLRVVAMEHYAGLFSFLTHQVSTILVVGTWSLPVIKHVVWFLNRWLIVWPSLWLDGVTDRRKRFSAGLVAVAEKK